MATNTLNTRLVIANKIEANWQGSSTVPLGGEICYSSDTGKFKIGNGVDVWKDLPYRTMTPEEITTLINTITSQSGHVHTNKDVLDQITAAFTTELLTKLNGIADEANKTIVDSALSASSTNPVQNKIVKSALDAKVPTSRTVNGKALSGNITLSASDVSAIPTAKMGVADGVATLDSDGKVPSTQLPSYVDDVVEGYFNSPKFYKDAAFKSEITGETGKIYVDLNDGKVYRWGGSVYAVVSDTIAIGDTANTAFRGDWGKIAYDYSQADHAPVDAEKNTIVSIKKNGTALTIDAARSVNIEVPTNNNQLANGAGYITSSGTAAKADKLSTARSIDGVNFDGSANIYHYATCSTAAGTAAKTVSIDNYVLATGSYIMVMFTVTNTANNPTLNVNATGAKAIRYRNAAINKGVLAANRLYTFVYDGTYWQLAGDLDTNTTYSAGSGLSLDGTTINHASTITAGTAQSGTGNVTLTFGGTFNIPYITYNATGHITAVGVRTITMPAAPTSVSGNAGSATKLANARNFSITGGATAAAVSFDGTDNVALDVTALDAMKIVVNAGDTLILNGNWT